MEKGKLVPKILRRERIDQMLEGIFHHPLVVVTAPMGYGKSMAVQEYLKDKECQCLWTAMSYAIGTAASGYFWHLLMRTMEPYAPELKKVLEQRGFPKDSIGIAQVIDELRAYPWEREAVLVFDDFQYVENSQIDTLLTRVACAGIPKLHLVVISRKMPEIPLVELSIKGICQVVKTADLSFTDQEVNEYLDLVEFQGDSGVREEILRCANGWITSVYLLANNYSNGFQYAPIYSMLKYSMFEQLDEASKRMLFRLSVFDLFTVEQAIEVLEDPGVGSRLEKLYQNNAFITTVGDTQFRIHQIFRNFLRKECVYYGVDLTPVYRRAGQWFAQHGDHIQAYQHWLSGGDYDSILRSLEGARNARLSAEDEELMFQVFHYIDAAYYCPYPLATLKYVTYLAVNGYKGLAARILEELQQYYGEHTHEKYDMRQLQGEFHVAWAMMCLDDIERVELELRQARELLGEGGSLLHNRETRPPCGTPEFSYAFFNRSGTYQETVRRLGMALRDGICLTGGSGAGCAELVGAEYYLETGHFDQVEGLAKQAVSEARKHGQNWVQVAAKFTLARLYMLKYQMEDAQEILNYFFYLQNEAPDPGLADQISASIGYLYSVMGEIENIPSDFCKDMARYSARGMESAFFYLVCEKALLAEEAYEELERQSNFFLERYNSFHSQLGCIHHHIIMAVVKYKRHGVERGLGELNEALTLALQDGVLLPFIENAQRLAPMLKPEMLNENPDFWSKVLAYSHEYDRPQQSGVGRCGVLSAREVEIMSLLEKGKRQKEIAEALYISPNTVKKHMENIYHKLNVNNKTLALKEFQRLQTQRESSMF